MKVHSALPSPTGSPLKSPLWSRAGTRVPSPVQEEDEDEDCVSMVVLAENPAQILSERATAQGEDSTKLSSTPLVRDIGLKRLCIDTCNDHEKDSPINVKPRSVSWPMSPMSPWSPGPGNTSGGNEGKLAGRQQWQGKDVRRPFFSMIADGVHVHPQAVAMAYNAHPTGCVLVSDGECTILLSVLRATSVADSHSHVVHGSFTRKRSLRLAGRKSD